MAGGKKTLACGTVIFTCLTFICGFNIDTTIPVIKKGPANSYFGYSVAEHQVARKLSSFPVVLSDEVEQNLLLVGAPNLNTFPVAKENYTGGFYSCPLSTRTDDCVRHLTEQTETTDNSQPDAGRNNQWFGVVVRSGGKGREVVKDVEGESIQAAVSRVYRSMNQPYPLRASKYDSVAHAYNQNERVQSMFLRSGHCNRALLDYTENKRYKKTSNNFGIGTCYQLSQELKFENRQLSPCAGKPFGQEHEEYAFCQSGSSAYLTDEHEVLIGSPGAVNWRGMITKLNVSDNIRTDRRLYESPTTENKPVPINSYLGYSVVGGKFDHTGQTYYVAGAPHSGNHSGQVVFFTRPSGPNLLWQESQRLSGKKPFSGFGHDLIAVDINGDGFDDLVVGCPFYFDQDVTSLGGAVYVYTGKGDMITDYTTPQLILGRNMTQKDCNDLDCHHGRFGFSLANAGDLNLDGFGDFAVGAPYEGNGAVYIFHGSEDGVVEPFSQRIYADEVPNQLMTLGYSLSGGMDLDSNGYPDLLVGAYESNAVALLRTRPIMHLFSNVTVSPKTINMSLPKLCEFDTVEVNKFCVKVRGCLRFTAEPKDRFLGSPAIIYRLEAEPGRGGVGPRIEFKFPTSSDGYVVEKRFTLLPQALNGDSCFEEIAYLKQQFSDVLNNLTFALSFRLPKRTDPLPTGLNGLPDINSLPILDAGTASLDSQFVTEVAFAKLCGEDQICQSDLKMAVDIKGLRRDDEGKAVLDIGGSKPLEVEVNLRNEGEVAYQTLFYLEKPASLGWQSAVPKDVGCGKYQEGDTESDTLIECNELGDKEVGRPFRATQQKSFVLSFGTQNISSQYKEIKLVAWVNTTSKEKTPSLDRIELTIRIVVIADIEVTGTSAPDGVIRYIGNVRGESAISQESEIGPAVNHTYVVENHGPGSVEESEMMVYWPYELASRYPHGKHLLYLMQRPQEVYGPITCYDEPDTVNVLDITEDPAYIIRLRKQNTEVPYNVVERRRRRRRRESEVDPDTDENSQKGTGNSKDKNSAVPGKTGGPLNSEAPNIGESRELSGVVLGCKENTAKCKVFTCKIGKLEEGDYAKVVFRARVWESTLIQDYKDVSEVHIRSHAKVHIRPEFNVEQPYTDNDIGYAVTTAIPGGKLAPTKGVDWWIILVAVLGGLFLLIILIVILWKVGFFKRKRYDEVDATYKVEVEKKKDYPDETDHFLTKS